MFIQSLYLFWNGIFIFFSHWKCCVTVIRMNIVKTINLYQITKHLYKLKFIWLLLIRSLLTDESMHYCAWGYALSCMGICTFLLGSMKFHACIWIFNHNSQNKTWHFLSILIQWIELLKLIHISLLFSPTTTKLVFDFYCLHTTRSPSLYYKAESTVNASPHYIRQKHL